MKSVQKHKVQKNTYWTATGKYQKFADELSEKMPDFAYTDNQNMNLFIAMSHLYYDAYNNGSCNIEECFECDFDTYVRPLMPAIVIDDFVDCRWADMEMAMDKALEFLQGKDLNYTVYPAWMNFNACLVSLTQKSGKGWKLIRFGEEAERDKWVQSHLSPGFGFKKEA